MLALLEGRTVALFFPGIMYLYMYMYMAILSCILAPILHLLVLVTISDIVIEVRKSEGDVILVNVIDCIFLTLLIH